MNDRYYRLSMEEYSLLCLFNLERFITFIPCSFDFYLHDSVITYDNIDGLARVVYSRKYKGSNYGKLVSFVERLQEILEKNDDLC